MYDASSCESINTTYPKTVPIKINKLKQAELSCPMLPNDTFYIVAVLLEVMENILTTLELMFLYTMT